MEGDLTMPMTAEIVEWKEIKQVGVSSTVYNGIKIMIGDCPVVVSRLSHGLRVLLVNDAKQKFNHMVTRRAHVSDDFVREAKVAFEADLRFQKQVDAEYMRIMSI